MRVIPLEWRHKDHNGVSNHQPHGCLLTVYSDADQSKHQSSALLAFVRGIHRWPVNSPHKRPVTRKMFPFDDVIMHWTEWCDNLRYNPWFTITIIGSCVTVTPNQSPWPHFHFSVIFIFPVSPNMKWYHDNHRIKATPDLRCNDWS